MEPLIRLMKLIFWISASVLAAVMALMFASFNRHMDDLTLAVDRGSHRIAEAMAGEPRGPRPTVEEPQVSAPEPRRIREEPADLRRGLEVVRTSERIQYKRIDVFCMAKNIFHEAGVEDTLGKYAVAQVTLNRMRNPKYPSTVCDVVMDPWQFSWANDRSIRWTRPRGSTWEQSVDIAERVIIEGYRLRGLEQANYYHADYVRPRWKKPEAKIAKIGTHIFYASAR